jgi:L-asparagine transporter-like permease
MFMLLLFIFHSYFSLQNTTVQTWDDDPTGLSFLWKVNSLESKLFDELQFLVAAIEIRIDVVLPKAVKFTFVLGGSHF